jgi:hypothetical protein
MGMPPVEKGLAGLVINGLRATGSFAALPRNQNKVRKMKNVFPFARDGSVRVLARVGWLRNDQPC